ncbi:hypothetical protein E2C01_055617 [Portunus trituberculatus]|uniref:Uncharacterized protein n=1 Tax=Portunus trituberculatus TaxID=210409 RepID=A0A5B7GY62_PORTR|nr:hypothetical protein [Portunus trituberculatus]
MNVSHSVPPRGTARRTGVVLLDDRRSPIILLSPLHHNNQTTITRSLHSFPTPTHPPSLLLLLLTSPPSYAYLNLSHSGA